MSDKFNRGFVDDKGNSVKDSAYDLIHCIMTYEIWLAISLLPKIFLVRRLYAN